jgi:hypothetical protein
VGPLSTVGAGWTGSAGHRRAIGSSARCGGSGSYWMYRRDRSRMVIIVQSARQQDPHPRRRAHPRRHPLSAARSGRSPRRTETGVRTQRHRTRYGRGRRRHRHHTDRTSVRARGAVLGAATTAEGGGYRKGPKRAFVPGDAAQRGREATGATSFEPSVHSTAASPRLYRPGGRGRSAVVSGAAGRTPSATGR